MSPRALSLPESLPRELFYFHIIPYILSDHLHQLLVESDPPTWNAFHILPLVSRVFYYTCRSLYTQIFGLAPGDDYGPMIAHVLNEARTLWAGAKLPARRSQPLRERSYRELMSSSSLIQVYMCTALAKSFLNLDVVWPIELKASISALRDDEREEMGGDSDLDEPNLGGRSHRFRMREDLMHRVYLPLTCAIKLCDSVQPEPLAHIVAEYLASLVPFYSTVPVMLKYTQSLETFVAREHTLEMGLWTEWTVQTLGLIEETKSLLRRMQNMGKLVKSFKQSSSIPRKVLDDTNILQVLQEVVEADWGPDSSDVRERAELILDQLNTAT